MPRAKYPIRQAIAVDVDETLLIGGEANQDLVAWLEDKKAAGMEITLWSARGKVYAQGVADKTGTTHLFDHIISKPGVIVDDKGWSWIKWTQVIRI